MKTSSVKNNYTVVFTTALILVFLGAVYFFVYVPQNEKRLQEQRFRSLQSIEKNIHEKIDNSVALMNNLLKDTVDIKYVQHLNTNSGENFSLVLLPQPSSSAKLILKNITDSNYTIGINNTTRQIVLLLEKQIVQVNDTLRYQIAMKFSFEQFFKFLLPGYVFDHYIIFNNGEVVYESLPSGVSYLK